MLLKFLTQNLSYIPDYFKDIFLLIVVTKWSLGTKAIISFTLKDYFKINNT